MTCEIISENGNLFIDHSHKGKGHEKHRTYLTVENGQIKETEVVGDVIVGISINGRVILA